MTLSGYTLLLSLGIFFAEMCVVTLGTMRIIFIARGRCYLAPLLGFFEVITWLFAITQVMQNLNSIECFLAFAFGFSSGSYLGMLIEKKLAMGKVLVRIIARTGVGNLLSELRSANYGYTCVWGEGTTGPVRVIMTVVKRRQLDDVIRRIEAFEPRPFYAVDELQAASDTNVSTAEPKTGVLPSVLALRGKWDNVGPDELLMMRPAHEQAEHAAQTHEQARQSA